MPTTRTGAGTAGGSRARGEENRRRGGPGARLPAGERAGASSPGAETDEARLARDDSGGRAQSGGATPRGRAAVREPRARGRGGGPAHGRRDHRGRAATRARAAGRGRARGKAIVVDTGQERARLLSELERERSLLQRDTGRTRLARRDRGRPADRRRSCSPPPSDGEKNSCARARPKRSARPPRSSRTRSDTRSNCSRKPRARRRAIVAGAERERARLAEELARERSVLEETRTTALRLSGRHARGGRHCWRERGVSECATPRRGSVRENVNRRRPLGRTSGTSTRAHIHIGVETA